MFELSLNPWLQKLARIKTMEINSDFSQRVVVHSTELPWAKSPMPGVERRMLDRIGDEVARATSIVRYAPESKFSAHVHSGGEEFIVLEGVFQDEHGDYPVGSYLRNPPQSKHTPGSESGCTIFVKLWQFEPADRTPVRVNFAEIPDIISRDREGVTIKPLFKDHREEVRLEIWQPEIEVELDLPFGAEILVLEGALSAEQDSLARGSWLRMPANSQLSARAGLAGTKIWLKLGLDESFFEVRNR